jgi:NADH-quinone oxidoreductase subunit G
VVIPTLTVFEKSGSFINQQFRLQRFVPAVPGPSGVADDLVTLSKLVAVAGGPALAGDIDDLWTTLAAEVKPLVTVTYRNLPATGLLLDAGDLAKLPFAEGAGLHFEPKP